MSILNLKRQDNAFEKDLAERFALEFPNVKVSKIMHSGSGRYFNQYYIQFTPDNFPSGMHFEYYVDGWVGALEFHIEPDGHNEDQVRAYRKIGIRLMKQTSDLGVEWNRRWGLPCGKCWLKEWRINSIDQLIGHYRQLSAIIEKRLETLYDHNREIKLVLADNEINDQTSFVSLTNEDETVAVHIKSLQDVMNMKLRLPVYQRDYCWEDDNIISLWKSLQKMTPGEPYHLGTIILHENDNKFDIIDGQQRLLTLTLILLGLGYGDKLPLLNESYSSTEAIDHVSNCKFMIRSLIEKCDNPSGMLENISKFVSFAVLIVNDGNLDLAYTFFSNQNSKGVTLSDFDLLKAHHLRFIIDERQSEHLATKWNTTSQKFVSTKERTTLLHRAVGTHVYRLRKWMRKNQSEENRYRYIQREYQASPIMAAIPPFCETFDFYEKIQGGTHFFAFVDKFVYAYEQFRNLQVVKVLNSKMANREYGIFADVIETLLFGYFLKFGSEQYLPEALFCISQIMALHRYNENSIRRDGSSVRDFANRSELTLMIDQASSPTFFLAEALNKLEWYVQEGIYNIISGLDVPEVGGIKYRIYENLTSIWRELSEDITDAEIKTRIKEEYGQ